MPCLWCKGGIEIGVKIIKINSIEVNQELFLRFGYNRDAIERYKTMYEEGKSKPIQVGIKNGGKPVLIDGFHRITACNELGKTVIDAEIIESDGKNLVELAIQANINHGVPLTKDELYYQIGKLKYEQGYSQEQIGEVFGYGQSRIAQIINDINFNTINKLLIQKYEQENINKESAYILDWLDGKTQQEIAKKYSISQPAISTRIKEFVGFIKNKWQTGQLLEEIPTLDTSEELRFDITELNLTKNLIKKELIKQKIPEWQLDINKIIIGNCLTELPKIPEQTIDLIYADPPYYRTEEEWDQFKNINDYLDFTKQWIEKCIPLFKNKYHFFINFSSEYFADLEMICRDLNLPIKSRVIWRHGNMSLGKDMQNQFGRQYDPILHIGTKNLNFPEPWGNERFDVWDFAVPQSNFEDKKEHRTQKPLELLKRIIQLATDNNSLVLDPFAGSGTTGIACRKLQRDYILIEQSKEYVDIIKNRMGINNE